MNVPQRVIGGIEFLLVIADTAVDMCYADKDEQANVKAVGEWLQEVKREGKRCESE